MTDKLIQNFNGIIPSPVDYRDYAEPIVSTALLPDKIELPLPYPILNQEDTPYCGGAAGAGAAGAFFRDHFSMTWIYGLAKRYDGIPDLPGTYGRAVCKVMQKYGCALERYQRFPSIDINPTVFPEAAKYRLKDYTRLTTLIDMKAALARGRYLLIATFVSADNWGWGNNGFIGEARGEFLGAHLSLLNSYDNHLDSGVYKGYFGGVNSWSKYWGYKGRYFLPYEYLKFYVPDTPMKKFIEAWSVEFAPSVNWLSHYQSLKNIKRRLWAGMSLLEGGFNYGDTPVT